MITKDYEKYFEKDFFEVEENIAVNLFGITVIEKKTLTKTEICSQNLP